jgi:hypothetical protein
MRTAANVEVTTDSEKAAATFFEEIHRLLANFNVALQDESKDRKYRFVTKRLMKANQQPGDEIDEELGYYRKLHHTALCRTAPRCTVLYCTSRHQHCTTLHYT